MPLTYLWYATTVPIPQTRESFESHFNSGDSRTTFGGSGIYDNPITLKDNMAEVIPGATIPTTNLAFKLEGFIFIPVDGTYSFRINSDDAGDIIINGKLVSYWYGGHGMHPTVTPPASWEGSIVLTRGYHHFSSRFQSGGGGYGMEVAWKKPGDGSYNVIPSKQFTTEYRSISHKDEPVAIKTCIPVDKNTAFLAHYDITTDESLRGLESNLSSVATLRPYEGRYGGGVSVESATENNILQEVDAWRSTVGTYEETWMDQPVYYADGTATGGGFSHNRVSDIEIPPGEIWTYSLWINRHTANYHPTFYPQGRTWDGVTGVWTSRDPISPYISITKSYYDINGNDLGSLDYSGFTGWVKAVFTLTNTHTDKIYFTNLYMLSSMFTTGRCLHSQPQLEKRKYASSFTTGSRGNGNLQYNLDKSVWEGDFTFSAWGRTDATDDYRMIASVWSKWYLAWSPGSTSQLMFSWREDGTQRAVGTGVIPKADSKKWSFYTLTYKKSLKRASIYLDGALVFQGSSNNLNSTLYTTLSVGALSGGSLQFNGILDEVRVDTVARSADEIMQWYLSQAPFFPRGVHRIYS